MPPPSTIFTMKTVKIHEGPGWVPPSAAGPIGGKSQTSDDLEMTPSLVCGFPPVAQPGKAGRPTRWSSCAFMEPHVLHGENQCRPSDRTVADRPRPSVLASYQKSIDVMIRFAPSISMTRVSPPAGIEFRSSTFWSSPFAKWITTR